MEAQEESKSHLPSEEVSAASAKTPRRLVTRPSTSHCTVVLMSDHWGTADECSQHTRS